MEESKIEKYLKKEIELLSGKALKFISPGTSGVPDRIVLLPQGKIIFVELKAPGKKPRPMQEYRIKELKALGFRVEIIDSIEGVNNFAKEIKENV